LTDANGIPVALLLTAANQHDSTQLLPLLDASQASQQRIGRSGQRPVKVLGDRAYDSEPHREALRQRGILPLLAKRRTPSGSGLGRERWVVERTFAWSDDFRRLRVRYERYPELYEAFLKIASTLICYNHLKHSFC
jgi:transposase